MRTEIISKRNLNSKHFDNENGIFTMETHIGHIHYKDKQTKKFENVDCQFLPTDYGWEMRKNNYEVEIPKKANGWFRFINSFGFDSRGIEKVNKPNEIVSIKPLGISAIEGQSITRPQWKGKGIVLYKDAYGQDIDLEVMARNTGFIKEVVINKKPVDLSKDLEFNFEVDIGDLIVKPKKKDFNKLRKEKVDILRPIRDKAILLEKQGKVSQACQEHKKLMREQEKWEDNLEKDIWDKQGILETSDSIILEKLRKTWFRQFNLFDAGGNRGIIKVRLESIGGKFILTKVLDRRFLDNAIYPVRTDTTTSYYAGAGDGMVRYYLGGSQPSQANWDTAHNAAIGNDADYTGTNNSGGDGIRLVGVGDYTWIGRSFFPIDTSGLGAGAIISAAILKLYGLQVGDNYNGDGYDYLAVVQTFQPSTSGLTTADYDLCGDAIDNPTKGSADIDITGLVINNYNDFTLNDTGLTWISKTGVTMLGYREGHDIQDNFPGDPGEADKYSRFIISTSEATNTSQDPYLSVTYTVPQNYTQSLSENPAVVDSIIKTIGKKMTENNTLADSINKNADKNLGEINNLSDSLKFGNIKNLIETINLADLLSKNARIAMSEIMTLADIKILTVRKNLSESNLLNDGLTGRVGKGISDSITLTDQQAFANQKAISENLAITDDLAPIGGFIRALNEIIATSDQIAPQTAFNRLFTENIVLLDEITVSLVFQAVLVENLSLSEVMAFNVGKKISDDISINDTIASFKQFFISLLDNPGITDDLKNRIEKILSDQNILADNLLINLIIQKSLTEAVAISDIIQFAAQKGITEIINLVDGLAQSLSKNLNEQILVVEIIQHQHNSFININENISLSDIVVAQLEYKISILENLQVAEILIKDYNKSILEAITITDSITTLQKERLYKKTIVMSQKKDKIILISNLN